MSADRRRTPLVVRPSFATLAREAIAKHVPETHGPDAWWSLGNNAVWVRWPLPDGVYAYLGLNRHLDWLSGEAGVSREPRRLSALFPLPGMPPADVPGFRVRLGHLLDEGDRWWPAGSAEHELVERLEWMAIQLRAKGSAYFSRMTESTR